MKKKIFLLLVAVLSIATNLWALDAPTMPEFVAPESGGTYYLYNVESGLWMTMIKNSDSYVGVGIKGLPVLVTLESNGAFSMKFTTTNGYIYNAYGNSYVSTSYLLNSYCYWSITNDGDIYNIQRSQQNSYYRAKEYLGRAGETSDYVYANKALGENTSWKFVAVTDASTHYFAELALYEALKPMDAFAETGLIDDYLTMYANRATINDEDLYDASKTLIQHRMSNGYIASWWNEYPILFYTPDGSFGQNSTYTWALPNNNYTSGSNFTRSIYYKDSPKTSSLSATVIVDETSTFVYSTDGDNSDVTLEVYVDGTKVRTLKNRFFRFSRWPDRA